MSAPDTFQTGDVVFHPRRREWGQGVVEKAAPVTHQGKSGQRLVVRFDHHGRVTLNTAVVPLLSKDVVDAMKSSTAGQGWLGTLERKQDKGSELYELPDAMSDPFLSPARRLSTILESYRYSREDPRQLLEWAIAQTGLQDPLTRYTRQELEQAFPRFARERDQLLHDLVRHIMTKEDRQIIGDVYQRTRLPAAREALQRATRR